MLTSLGTAPPFINDFLLKSLISMNDFQKEKQSAQTDCLLLSQTPATRKYCKSKALNCSDVIQKTEIGFCHQNLSYIMNWIEFNGQLQNHKTYLPKLIYHSES